MNLPVGSWFEVYPYCVDKRGSYQKSTSSKRCAPWQPLKIQKELYFSYPQFSRKIAYINLLVRSGFGVYPHWGDKRGSYQKSISSKRCSPWHPLKIQKELDFSYRQFSRKIVFRNLLVGSGFGVYPYCGDKRGSYQKSTSSKQCAPWQPLKIQKKLDISDHLFFRKIVYMNLLVSSGFRVSP